MEYVLLFLSAFVAATLLPLSSEVLLVSLLGSADHALLWIVATLGNCTGATLNWYLGRYLLHYQQHPWFPFKPDSLVRAQSWFSRFGKWSLLFSWLPLIGDGFTFIAGVMRIHIAQFMLLTLIAKGARYAFVLYAYHLASNNV